MKREKKIKKISKKVVPLTNKAIKFILFAFLICFFLTLVVCALSQIDDDSLKNIATAVSSSVLGGLLTLSGVLLTIEYEKNIRKREEKLKHKPVFTLAAREKEHEMKNYDNNGKGKIICNLDTKKDNKTSYIYKSVNIKNFDTSHFKFIGLTLDNDTYNLEYDLYVEKNAEIKIRFAIEKGFELDKAKAVIEVEDLSVNKNRYCYNIKFKNNLPTEIAERN